MSDLPKQDAPNLYDKIRYEAQEKQRLEAERQDRAKQIFNRPKTDTLNQAKGDSK